MMNPVLIKKPTTNLWKAEFEEMLNGKKTDDFEKLGSAGAYVQNIFLYTLKNNETLNRSVDLFFEVFESKLTKLIKEPALTSLQLEIMIDIAAAFVKQYNDKTFSINYLQKITDLVNAYIKLKNTSNVKQNEGAFYSYLHYLKVFVLPVEEEGFNNIIAETKIDEIKKDDPLIKSIHTILKFSILHFEKTTSGLATFLLYLLNYCVKELSLSDTLQTELVEYSIANKAATNNLISKAILKFATENEAEFKNILNTMQCRLTSDGFNIIYNNGTFKHLELESQQWEMLNETYHLNAKPVHEILNEHLNRNL